MVESFEKPASTLSDSLNNAKRGQRDADVFHVYLRVLIVGAPVLHGLSYAVRAGIGPEEHWKRVANELQDYWGVWIVIPATALLLLLARRVGLSVDRRTATIYLGASSVVVWSILHVAYGRWFGYADHFEAITYLLCAFPATLTVAVIFFTLLIRLLERATGEPLESREWGQERHDADDHAPCAVRGRDAR